MDVGAEIAKLEGLPEPVWRRIVANPERAPELIALAASKRFADPAAEWVRENSSWRQPDRLAKKAYSKHVHLSRIEGLALGLGGMVTSAFNVAGLGWLQARMVFYIAAALGYDPHDPMRPAELLFLWGVYESPEQARESLEGVGESMAVTAGQDPAVQAQPAVADQQDAALRGQAHGQALRRADDPAARLPHQRGPERRLDEGPGPARAEVLRRLTAGETRARRIRDCAQRAPALRSADHSQAEGLTHMAKRISLMLVAALILVFAVTAVGCGGDDKDSGGSGDNSSQSGDSGSKDSGSGDSANDTPDNVDEAVDKCLEEAAKAPDGNAKEAAEKLCNAAKSRDPEKIKDSARDACLELAKQIPAGAQRDQAEQACKEGTQ